MMSEVLSCDEIDAFERNNHHIGPELIGNAWMEEPKLPTNFYTFYRNLNLKP